MKQIILIISFALVFLLPACEKEATSISNQKIYLGFEESDFGLSLYKISPSTSKANKLTYFHNFPKLRKGVFTYDELRNTIVLGTENGVTAIELQSQKTTYSFPDIQEIQYSKKLDKLYGLHYSTSLQQWHYIEINPSNLEQKVIKRLTSFLSVVQGSANYNSKLNHFLFNTDRGLFVLNASTGEVLHTLQGVTNTEFNTATGQVIGLKTNNLSEIVDIISAEAIFQPLATISGGGGVIVGATAFDSNNEHYILETGLGPSVIQYKTGEIIASYPNFLQLMVVNAAETNTAGSTY